jgi:hypothetical protein
MSGRRSVSLARRRDAWRPRVALLTTAIGLAGVAWPLRAHDTWLLPAQARVQPRTSVSLGITSGMDFPKDESAIAADRVGRSGVRLGGAERPFARKEEGEHALRLTVELTRPGIATAWVELKPRTIDLTPDDVAHYLEEIGAPAAVLSRWQAMPEPRRWRESYRKHVKSFVRVGDGPSDR